MVEGVKHHRNAGHDGWLASMEMRARWAQRVFTAPVRRSRMVPEKLASSRRAELGVTVPNGAATGHAKPPPV